LSQYFERGAQHSRYDARAATADANTTRCRVAGFPFSRAEEGGHSIVDPYSNRTVQW
jgi:hypothetical protein